MTREDARWGAATALAVLLCLGALPLGDGRLIATTTGKKTGSPQGDGGECAKCSATAQQHFVFELFHYASFLRSGYRAGTQHIVGRIKLEFIS